MPEDKPETTPEAQKVPSDAEKLAQLTQLYTNLNFFSNQVEVNATLWQGYRIMLTKLNDIEQKLNKIEELLTKKDGTQG